MQLARQKVGKKHTHPNHGGRHCPTAAMVPSSRHCHIQQLANMLHDKSVLLKLENIIVLLLISYFKARLIVEAFSMRCACVFAGCISGRH
jgi:hypothetical protein